MTRYAVKRALAHRGLRTRRARHLDASRQARADGVRRITRKCPKHGLRTFAKDGRGTFRCMKCRSEAVTRRRRQMKEILVAEAGGGWAAGGYSRRGAA